jgi:phosphoribosylglycinamide formyltransferase-1
VAILPEDTLETLETRIHQVEHRIFPQVIQQLAQKNKG